MADHKEIALYSPYGAYELKSKYQRNFMYGTGLVAGFVIFILAVFWVMDVMAQEEAINTAPVIIKTVAELGPPPTIAKKPPQVKVDQPQVQAPRVGIPTPVADEDVMDEDVVLATREEMAEIVAPTVTDLAGDGDIVVDIADDDYLPGIDEFVPVEEQPEMIKQVDPEYPRLAKQAGLEGLVWIKALVGKDGSVLDAVVYKSSGTASLDEAALEVAKDNVFRPAIQNGRPVTVWVAYRVNFDLEGN